MKLSFGLSSRDFTLGLACWWGTSYFTLSFLIFTLNFDWEREWI